MLGKIVCNRIVLTPLSCAVFLLNTWIYFNVWCNTSKSLNLLHTFHNLVECSVFFSIVRISRLNFHKYFYCIKITQLLMLQIFRNSLYSRVFDVGSTPLLRHPETNPERVQGRCTLGSVIMSIKLHNERSCGELFVFKKTLIISRS